MIKIIESAPRNVAAFEAADEVTKEDFENVVMPYVNKIVEQEDELNYLLQLRTPLSKFTAGAWVQDALLGLKNLAKWNRVAIVTDKEGIQTFTDIFSKFMPGEFRGYDHIDYKDAERWVSTGED
ncbi:MAG: STAS/SEC14 domain-containing protein [Chryseobacterium sp.]|nr:MAG: STAS/SEC14 domain-containing protein [Chryseobacterium sp.]